MNDDEEYDDEDDEEEYDGDEDERMELARQHLDDQDSTKAIELLDAVIASDPENIEAFDDRGLAYMQLDNDGRAVKDFRRVVALDDEDEAGYTHLAEALRNLGKYDEALTAVAKALDLAPDDIDAHYVRGWLFFRCGQYQTAIEDLERFVDGADEAGEVSDMLTICRDIAARHCDEEEVERILRLNGFSADTTRNGDYEAEELFCPYAHCVRLQAARGTEAADCCPKTGFACPGGGKQACTCEKNPFA